MRPAYGQNLEKTVKTMYLELGQNTIEVQSKKGQNTYLVL